ncbi:histidine kinase [Kriegella sp. EG-1]|nr:histidine kinase [Flavobacteriaceae bacterium EG-1]
MDYSDKESKYLRAQERVDELKKFYSNIISYVLVIAMLAGINYYTDQWNYPWFLWAAFGWGIGIIFNAIKVFGSDPFLGKGWEERKIKELMNEDKEANRWK